MVDKNDWRLQGQEKYLLGAKLKLCEFDGEHDHCSFCWEKFSKNDNDLKNGYCTLDNYHWICQKCFNDFKDMFNWYAV